MRRLFSTVNQKKFSKMLDAMERLKKALKTLPGVGPKSAERLSFHLMQNERAAAEELGRSLLFALENVRHCARCNNFTSEEICALCKSGKRDSKKLCVVESPIDLNRVEQTLAFDGLYYVLMGRISPLDGVTGRDLHLENFLARALDGVVSEVILAMNFTNEGELTAHYLQTLLKEKGLTVTRIARGVPVGGELEFVDSGTLAHAIRQRQFY